MVKIKVDGIEVEVANDAFAQLIERAISERDKKIDSLEDLMKKKEEEEEETEKKAKADSDALRARADVAETKVKELEKLRADEASKIPVLVKARVDLESKARDILGQDAKLDDKTDREVKALVIAKLSPDVKVDGEADAYVDSAYKGVLAVASSEALAKVRAAANAGDKGRRDASDRVVDPEAARRKAHQDSEQEWKAPLTGHRA